MTPRFVALVLLWSLALSHAGAATARAEPQAAAPPAAGSTVPDGVDSSRLFFGPTARSLNAGEGYFSLNGAVIPSFQVGVTDRFSIGAGTFFFLEGVFWVTPKLQLLRRGATSVAAGVMHLAVPGEGQLGLAFASATRDGRRGGLTVGAGVAYTTLAEDEDFSTGGPLLMIGGDYRVSRRVVFVNETYVVLGGGALSMNGIRTTWGRFSLDTAVLVIVGGDEAVGGPVINLSWKFGGR